MTRPISLPQQAHAILQAHLQNGDIAIDATAGNGHDTLFLAQQVAPLGQVYSFDIQAAAITATHHRLLTADLRPVVLLNQHSHAQMSEFIAPEHQGKIKAVMFNLGYLPRGDKSIITQTASTLSALNTAAELLAEAGIMSILAYPGHQGGECETVQVANWCYQLNPENFTVQIILSAEHKDSAPRLFVLQKSAKTANLL
jgi:predicted methyltransferase